MKQNNANTARFYIATDPTNETDKKMLELVGITNIANAKTAKSADQPYFGNYGEVCEIIVGGKQTISVSFDYDNEDPAHLYLYKLSLKTFIDWNGQYMVLENNNLNEETQYKYGKMAIKFKTLPTTGAPDELIKMEFDIAPQDQVWITGTTKPAWFPDPVWETTSAAEPTEPTEPQE